MPAAVPLKLKPRQCVVTMQQQAMHVVGHLLLEGLLIWQAAPRSAEDARGKLIQVRCAALSSLLFSDGVHVYCSKHKLVHQDRGTVSCGIASYEPWLHHLQCLHVVCMYTHCGSECCVCVLGTRLSLIHISEPTRPY